MILKKFDLRAALIISLTIHALFLFIKFGHYKRETQNLRQADIPLEVQLVNASSTVSPKKAYILAQTNLHGGGEDKIGRATTFLPATNKIQEGELIKRLKKRELQLQIERAQILSRRSLKNEINNDYKLAKNTATHAQPNHLKSDNRDSYDVDLIRRNLEAEIAKNEQLIAKRPRRTQITASSAIAVNFATYYHRVKSKIERYGTLHFPHENSKDGSIEKKPLYGSLVLVLNVNQNGMLGYIRNGYLIAAVNLKRSSGNALLDRQAIAIAQATAPFGKFPAEMAANFDLLEIIYTFNFTHEGLEAKAGYE